MHVSCVHTQVFSADSKLFFHTQQEFESSEEHITKKRGEQVLEISLLKRTFQD